MNPTTSIALHTALEFLRIIAREVTNRHVAAAMTSSLFNLVLKTEQVDRDAQGADFNRTASAIYLENLIPAPPDTSAIVPPPKHDDPRFIDTVFSMDPWSAKPQTKTCLVDTDVETDACHSFAEYYRDNFKSKPAVWEPIHSIFSSLRPGLDSPLPATIHVDADAINSSECMPTPTEENHIDTNSTNDFTFDVEAIRNDISHMEQDLYNIDGPPETWSFKKSLRQRARGLLEKLSIAKGVPCDANSDVWMQFSPCVALAKNSKVAVCSDCLDDSEPRVELPKGSYCTMVNIDREGDFKLQLGDRTIWIFKQRSNVLRI